MENQNRFIPQVIIKPGRYADHELNAARKPWDGAVVRLCLAYPDQYEIGMSNLGLAVLYSVVNRLPWAMADRAFLPAPDMEAALRGRSIPLMALESNRPLRDFDIVGISLQTELCYTNVLAMLDLAKIPRRAADRREEDPIVLAGGACCANPEPMAAFFDAMAIGDGEELIAEICRLLYECKSETRKTKLDRLSSVPGVYIPSVHDPHRDLIRSRHVAELKPEYAPHPPLVPLVEVTHDRLTVEIARGCTRGCRFCQAGMLYRPTRIRSQKEVLELVRTGLASSGWEEVSLLSLSSCDYPDFPGLLDKVNGICLGQRVAVSVPSLRLDSFDQAMAGCLKRIKRSSLTFAPEAGTQRLRDVVNKGLSDEHLFTALELARRNGWQGVKLYFMIGLPTETSEDLEGIVSLCRRASAIGLNLKVTISPFVPKPQTPFQWEAQNGLEELRIKIGYLIQRLRMPRVQTRWHDPKSSAVEGMLARGGRECADLIEKAYLAGASSDQWTEHFRWEIWRAALAASGVDVNQGFGGRDVGQRLPWEHIDFGVKRGFLLAERKKALAGQTTPDCRETGCYECGASCKGKEPSLRIALGQEDREQKDGIEEPAAIIPRVVSLTEGSAYGRRKRAASPRLQVSGTRFRIKYGKGPELRFISHLDLMRLWQRAIRRSGLPMAYSQGFTPHQKISFGPPLPLGMTSRGEYLDLQLEKPAAGELSTLLQKALNPGINILGIKPMLKEAESLSSWVNAAGYEVIYDSEESMQFKESAEKAIGMVRDKQQFFIKIERKGLTKEIDIIDQIYDIKINKENNLEIIIKALDKGAKPMEIIKALAFIDESKGNYKIERIEMYHFSGQGLFSPLDILGENGFRVRG